MDKITISNVNNVTRIYPMNDVKIDKGFYTIFELKRRYDANPKRIILDSDFQREAIWNRKRKSELIESVLMGLPLPIFYFSQDKYGRIIVVDGRQRLTAFFEYLNGEYALSELDILPEISGKKFADLSPVMRGKIEDYQIQAHVIIPPTPDRIKFDIFDRVNRGGVRLNKQEIRNALYQGQATALLNRIVLCEEFKKATGNAFKNEKRMKHKYFMNRFLAMYLLGHGVLRNEGENVYQYKGDIDELLGKCLDYINHMSSNEVNMLEQFIQRILADIYTHMGGDAFRLPKEGQSTKGPVNMNVFETVMYAFSVIVEQDGKLTKDKQILIDELLKSKDFQQNVQSYRDSEARYLWRMQAAQKVGRS